MIRNTHSVSGSFGTSTQQLVVSRFISKTYGWMFVGLMVTGLISLAVASSESAVGFIFQNRGVFYGILIAELLVVMGMSAIAERISAPVATLLFIIYSAMNGVTFSLIFMIYTAESIGQIFMISAGMFGGLALYGTLAKRDLTAMGTFFAMGVWGLILVGLVNLFFQSESLSLGMAAAGVLIFSGLTAYDAQRIRGLAYHYASGQRKGESKGAIFGALTLYLNFINLFMSLLRLFGNRR